MSKQGRYWGLLAVLLGAMFATSNKKLPELPTEAKPSSTAPRDHSRHGKPEVENNLNNSNGLKPNSDNKAWSGNELCSGIP